MIIDLRNFMIVRVMFYTYVVCFLLEFVVFIILLWNFHGSSYLLLIMNSRHFPNYLICVLVLLEIA